MPPRNNLWRNRADDDDDDEALQQDDVQRRRAEDNMREERQREQQAAQRERRDREAAERELRDAGTDRAGSTPAGDPKLLRSAQLVTQKDVAAVFAPLDYAKPIAPSGANPLEAPRRLRVLLHTDRPVLSPPVLLQASWTPTVRPSEHHAFGSDSDEVCMRRVGPTSSSGGACWLAELALPEAFKYPHLLMPMPAAADAASEQDDDGEGGAGGAGGEGGEGGAGAGGAGGAGGSDLGRTHGGVQDDEAALEAVQRLQADPDARAPWAAFEDVDCLLSRGLALHPGHGIGVGYKESTLVSRPRAAALRPQHTARRFRGRCSRCAEQAQLPFPHMSLPTAEMVAFAKRRAYR